MDKMLDSTDSAERRHQDDLSRREREDNLYRADATRWLVERLYGHGHRKGEVILRGAPSVFITTDHMLNDVEAYGFDGNSFDEDDMGSAIAAATANGGWEVYHFDKPEALPDDKAHAFILRPARRAVTEILEGAWAHSQIDDRIAELAADDY